MDTAGPRMTMSEGRQVKNEDWGGRRWGRDADPLQRTSTRAKRMLRGNDTRGTRAEAASVRSSAPKKFPQKKAKERHRQQGVEKPDVVKPAAIPYPDSSCRWCRQGYVHHAVYILHHARRFGGRLGLGKTALKKGTIGKLQIGILEP